jgi:hypothetical protein
MIIDRQFGKENYFIIFLKMYYLKRKKEYHTFVKICKTLQHRVNLNYAKVKNPLSYLGGPRMVCRM